MGHIAIAIPSDNVINVIDVNRITVTLRIAFSNATVIVQQCNSDIVLLAFGVFPAGVDVKLQCASREFDLGRPDPLSLKALAIFV